MSSSVSSTQSMSTALMAAMNPTSTSSTTATGGTDSSGNSVASDQNNFLTLLVTQMQNQDPLNPMDNSEVTSQLAQLSTVTGINQLNSTMTALSGSYQTSQSMQATSMIGHGVLAAGSTIALSSSSGIFGVNFGTAADSAQITIKDSSGNIVHTINMTNAPAGPMPLTWDGKEDDGTTVAPDGNYTFTVTATAGGAPLTDATTLAFGTVASVSTGTAGVKLNVPALGQLNLSDVQQIM